MLLHGNCSQSVGNYAAPVGVSHGTCYKILTDDLNKSRVAQHNIPCILTQDQRDECMTICGDLISRADDDQMFLNRIITGDKTWCFLYDPELKRQSTTQKMPVLSRQVKKQGDVVHMEFIPEGATKTKPATWRSLVAYAIQFIVNVLSFGIGRIGCCYTTTPLHIALSLPKRNLQGNRSPFFHTLCTHLLSTM